MQALANPQVLHQGQVEIIDARPADHVPGSVAEGPDGWKLNGRGVEILEKCPLALGQNQISRQERARRNGGRAGDVDVGGRRHTDSQRGAALETGDAGELPAVQNAARERTMRSRSDW